LRLSGLYINARNIFYDSDETDWMFLSSQALDRARSLEPGLADWKSVQTSICFPAGPGF